MVVSWWCHGGVLVVMVVSWWSWWCSPVLNTNYSESDHHTVVPLAVARKRMSEILSYKANECSTKLDTARTVVTEEMERLELHSDTAFNSVNRLFEELGEAVEKARLEMISEVRRRKTEKLRVLQHQLDQIQSERSGLAAPLQSSRSLVEARVSDLNVKLETIRSGQVRSAFTVETFIFFPENFPSRERIPTWSLRERAPCVQ